MAKKNAAALAAFRPSRQFEDHVVVHQTIVADDYGRPTETCGHHHATEAESEACLPLFGKNEEGYFRADVSLLVLPIAQVQPYVEPAKAYVAVPAPKNAALIQEKQNGKDERSTTRIYRGGGYGWNTYVHDDNGWITNMPLDGYYGEPETEAAAIRAMKDLAFVWGYTHLDLQNVDGDTIREFALSITPSRRHRLKEVVKRSSFPNNNSEHWMRVHRLAYRLGVLPAYKIRAIERHIPGWDWEAA